MNNLQELIKIELKIFGCQWELIGDKDPEDIANESSIHILDIFKASLSELPLLTRDELQKFAVGYIDYPRDKDGDYDMSHPTFQEGSIRPEWIEVAQAQLDQDLKKIKES